MKEIEKQVLKMLIRLCGALLSNNPDTIRSTAGDVKRQAEKLLESGK